MLNLVTMYYQLCVRLIKGNIKLKLCNLLGLLLPVVINRVAKIGLKSLSQTSHRFHFSGILKKNRKSFLFVLVSGLMYAVVRIVWYAI